MNNSILKVFAKNGLEILQWSILLLLYKAEAKGQTLKLEDIRNLLTFLRLKTQSPEVRTKTLLFERYFDLLNLNMNM